MINKQTILLLTMLVTTVTAIGSPLVTGNDVMYSSGKSVLRLSICTDKMFRVTKSTDGRMPENEKWMVTKYDFGHIDFVVNESNVTTRSLKIHVDKDPWRITVTDNRGRILYKEVDSSCKDSVCNVVTMNANEHFFGFGERMDNLDQRGQRIRLNVELGSGPKPAVGGKDILRANYCPIPLMLSNLGYAIFFHTAMPTNWDMGWSQYDRYSFSASGGDNDYFFIFGPSMESMIHSYQQLTGAAPLMPREAYGLHVGSYSGGTWKHEKEASDTYVIELISRLRREGVPFDLLWLDSTWRNFMSLGNGGCSFEFRETFKNPKNMIEYATKNHVAMLGLHVRSLLDNGKRNTLLDDARKSGYTITDGNTNAIVDFFSPEAVDWWWKNAAKRVTDLGVKFLKTDVGSALHFKNASLRQQQMHNLFPIAYAKAPYELFAQLNGQRGFNHTREGYAGIQRYPFIWAGDWGSEWQWFEPVIRGGLNIGLSGVGYWSHCMGGFEQYSAYDTDLYLRWCQFGMFSPVSILFGMDHPRYHAPWTYGEEAQRIFIKYDSLRYALQPYLYTSAWDMYQTGRPIMAPLLYDYTQDVITYNISNQFMFGRDMMICPVTVKNALSRPVYFPGGDWVDFWSGERILGRQHKSFLTPIDVMPIFIRRGAIIPQQEAMQYIGERPVKDITLLVYPSQYSSYNLYEDDGKSMDYQKGIYALTKIESCMKNKTWQLKIHKTEGKFKPTSHQFHVIAYLDDRPSSVEVDGHTISDWQYDDTLKRVSFHTGKNNQEGITIRVK